MAPADFKWWHELTEDERRVIPDSSDYPIIAIIDGIPLDNMSLIYHSIRPNTNGEYNKLQRKWINDEKYFLGLRLGRMPKPLEEIEDMEQKGINLRYRLYWAAKKWLDGKFDAFEINPKADENELDLLTDYFNEVFMAYKERVCFPEPA